MLARGFFGLFAATVAAMVVSAGAWAAPPPNDDFADREMLGGSLPIEVNRSNVEATKESGEFLNLFAAAGHSVWFEWEATSSGWVTIGACDGEDEFMRILGVYTGVAVNALTKVAEGNPSEGPACPFAQRQYTFAAVSGTKYEIAVDGNAFNPNPEFTPDTEGTFELRIEQTPVPPNDDFADAGVVAGRIDEEPDGNRAFWATVNGYNWGATKEVDEPDHEGDQGGASVWYTWVAPEAGSARINVCCSGPNLVALYQGGSLAELAPLTPAGAPIPAFSVQAGATYRIAVDGAFDGGAGAAELGSFQLQLFMELASGPGYEETDGNDDETGGNGTPIADPLPPSLSPADLFPPRTTIRKRSVKPTKGKAVFRFLSSEAGGSFRCRLDGRPLRGCKSPARFSGLRAGKHVFRVFAVDAAGNVDPTPALARFKIRDSAAG